MNVNVHLQNLGLNSSMISSVGSDQLGEELIQFLQSNSCKTDFIQVNPNQPTGFVAVTLNEKKEASYDIVQPVAWDYIELNEASIEGVSGAEAIVFSTLCARNETSKQTLKSLLSVAQLKVYDVNFRPPHTPRTTVEELLPMADIVKLNEEEFNSIASWYDIEPNISGLKFLIEKYKLKTIILTRGENGAMVVTATEVTESAGYQVKVADTVGSGDAFLAGFLKCYFEVKSLQTSVEYACALGALVASYNGATPKIIEANVHEMLR